MNLQEKIALAAFSGLVLLLLLTLGETYSLHRKLLYPEEGGAPWLLPASENHSLGSQERAELWALALYRLPVLLCFLFLSLPFLPRRR